MYVFAIVCEHEGARGHLKNSLYCFLGLFFFFFDQLYCYHKGGTTTFFFFGDLRCNKIIGILVNSSCIATTHRQEIGTHHLKLKSYKGVLVLEILLNYYYCSRSDVHGDTSDVLCVLDLRMRSFAFARGPVEQRGTWKKKGLFQLCTQFVFNRLYCYHQAWTTTLLKAWATTGLLYGEIWSVFK